MVLYDENGSKIPWKSQELQYVIFKLVSSMPDLVGLCFITTSEIQPETVAKLKQKFDELIIPIRPTFWCHVDKYLPRATDPTVPRIHYDQIVCPIEYFTRIFVVYFKCIYYYYRWIENESESFEDATGSRPSTTTSSSQKDVSFRFVSRQRRHRRNGYGKNFSALPASFPILVFSNKLIPVSVSYAHFKIFFSLSNSSFCRAIFIFSLAILVQTIL
jgi:hypothetical protein